MQWATAWTSLHRHYGTISTSPVEGMHKVLKDYLMTSRGDLLRVVDRIREMVHNQYSRYQKSIASAQMSVKFRHMTSNLPCLPADIHGIITPPAIELIRQQYMLCQQHSRKPCTGSFKKTYGLPCSHMLQSIRGLGRKLDLTHFDDDHWRYQRRQGLSITIIPRPNQHVIEPLVVQSRGRPRKNESSTRRDLSAFERPLPPTPRIQPQVQTLAEILSQTSTARINSSSIPATTGYSAVSTSALSRTQTKPAEQPAERPTEQSAEQFTLTPRHPLRDPLSLARHLADNGLEDAPADVAHAHIMAQERVGIFAHFTFDQALQFIRDNGIVESSESHRPPKRKAAKMASAAWTDLRPRKR